MRYNAVQCAIAFAFGSHPAIERPGTRCGHMSSTRRLGPGAAVANLQQRNEQPSEGAAAAGRDRTSTRGQCCRCITGQKKIHRGHNVFYGQIRSHEDVLAFINTAAARPSGYAPAVLAQLLGIHLIPYRSISSAKDSRTRDVR